MKIRNLEVKTFPCNGNKRPATPNGFEDGTFENTPSIIFGVNCGEAKDLAGNTKYLLAIDVDTEGLYNWEFLKAVKFTDEDLDTYTVRTPSGGLHYYYTTDLPYSIKKNLRKGIDLKYVGGYVLGPNSISNSGTYEVINDVDIKTLPSNIFEYSEEQFRNGTSNKDIDFEIVELTDEQKDNIIEGLIEHREWDDSYNSRFGILSAMKKLGFEFHDFADSVITGSSTGKNRGDWEKSWKSINDEVQPNDYKTIIKYSKVYIDCFLNEIEPDKTNDLLFLATLVQSKKVLKQFATKPIRLVNTFFSNNNYYKTIATEVIKNFLEDNEVATRSSLRYSFIEKSEDIKDFPLSAYLNIVDAIFDFDLTEYNEERTLADMIDKLNGYYTESKIKEINNDNRLNNEEKLNKISALRPFVVEEQADDISILNRKDLTEMYKDTDGKVVSSGYTEYDNLFGGGFKESEFTIFGGIAGIGKTMILGNFAVKAMLDNKKVVYFTFEVSTGVLNTRFQSNITGLSQTSIVLNRDNAFDALEVATSNCSGDIRIVEAGSNVYSTLDVRDKLERLIETGFTPDIIFLDYIGIMKSDDPTSNSDNTNQYQKNIAIGLRNIAKDFHIPVVSATQLNREAMAKEGGSTGGELRTLADSIGVGHTADNIITLNQTPKQKENNAMIFKIIKNRNGINNVSLLANLDYNTMKIKTMGKIK